MAATLTPTNISNLLSVEPEYPAPKIVVDQVQNKNWAADYERSVKDPEGFWAAEARKLHVDPAVDEGARLGWRPSQMVCRRQDQHHRSTPSIVMPIRERANRAASSGWARTAPNASSPMASFIGRFAVSRTG